MLSPIGLCFIPAFLLPFRIPVTISFIPNSDKEVNFNLSCHVKKKPQPLSLNVKAEGYSMECLVMCEDSTGSKVDLSADALNHINLGEVWGIYIHG